MKIRAILPFTFWLLLLVNFGVNAACNLLPRAAGDMPVGTLVTTHITPGANIVRMPKDIAIGSELYRITARQTSFASIHTNCNNNTTAYRYYTKGRFIGTTPSMAGITSTLGTVYATDVTGIGLVMLTGEATKFGSNLAYGGTCYGNTNSCGTPGSHADITFILIKTGVITDGTFDLSTLPLVEIVTGFSLVAGLDIPIFRPTLSGTVHFNQATCTLAERSKTVNLGKHHRLSLIGLIPYTPWVDASIELINCNNGGPQRYGVKKAGFSDGTPVSLIDITNTANALWSLKITPASNIINTSNGIMALSNQAGSATGVGIQLATTNTSSPTLIDFSKVVTGPIIEGANQTMRVPLYARYIKVSSTINGGKADGKITYTIEYK